MIIDYYYSGIIIALHCYVLMQLSKGKQKGTIIMEKPNIARRINNKLCFAERQVTWVFFLLMLALLFIQVLCRYVFNLPLAWAEEMVRYTYIAVSFIGATVACGENSHIMINILPGILHKQIKNERKYSITLDVIDIISNIIVIVFFALISMLLVNFNTGLYDKGMFTTSNQWPMWLMCLPLTVCCIVMGIQYLLNLWEKIIDLFNIFKSKGGAEL